MFGTDIVHKKKQKKIKNIMEMYWIGVFVAFITIFALIGCYQYASFKDFNPLMYVLLLFSFGSWIAVSVIVTLLGMYVIYLFTNMIISSLHNGN